jgi:hypothetical protein
MVVVVDRLPSLAEPIHRTVLPRRGSRRKRHWSG